MTLKGKLWVGAISLLTLSALGTLGYMVIEGASALDSLYMVIITITTVGFSEVFELSSWGKAWTIGVMALGVGIALYTVSAGFEQMLELSADRHKMRTQALISHFQDHVILCGYGRVGQGVATSLTQRGQEVVVVEANQKAVENAESAGLPVVQGNATSNNVLEAAGIKNAKALVACVTDDSDNLVIILSARSINPTIHLVSRASEHESEPKLRLAGADRVVEPQVVGSERLAAMAVEQNLTEVFDLFLSGKPVEFSVEEFWVNEQSGVVGKSIKDSQIREQSGALVLAVEDSEGTTLQTPTPDHIIRPNTAVVVVGTAAQVSAAAEMFNAS